MGGIFPVLSFLQLLQSNAETKIKLNGIVFFIVNYLLSATCSDDSFRFPCLLFYKDKYPQRFQCYYRQY